jgi:hypothetical protein
VTYLLFGPDGRLREQDRVVAAIAPDAGPDAVGRLVAEDIECVIVKRAGRADWRCDLLDEAGRRTGGFEPFRLRRGGRLRAGATRISLQGHSWSHDRWSFATPDGRRIEATVAPSTDARKAPSAGLEITLEAGTEAAATPLCAHAHVLAFGCWLIAQWHAVAPGDHMLTSTGAGGELASALGTSTRGGIVDSEAN